MNEPTAASPSDWHEHNRVPGALERRTGDELQILRPVVIEQDVCVELTTWPIREDGSIDHTRTVKSFAFPPIVMDGIAKVRAAATIPNPAAAA
jgi:hypothetical protein